MRISRLCILFLGLCVLASGAATAAAPAWMRELTSAPLPPHEDDADSVILLSETVLTVQGPGKIKRLDRWAGRILRTDGESMGTFRVSYDSQSRITALRGWSIPKDGKDYEVRQKDAIETSVFGVEGGELISDVRTVTLRVPAATVGSLIGFEVEREFRPYDMADEWYFQETVPVREARYTLQLPAGWSYKTFWLNHDEAQPTSLPNGATSWSLSNIKPIQPEANMPPWRGIAGRMVVSLQPPGSEQKGFQSWKDIGTWYTGLTRGRMEASAGIKQKVQELTADLPTPFAKIQALARFAQRDIRYVGIELGIGGYQPHAAADVFANRYGDCKDKVTLFSSMLKEIGVESYYVIVHTVRGSVTATTPPNLGFNHAIVALQLPENVDTAKLPAYTKHPKLGNLLYFDPTSEMIPLGQLPGALQASYGMLVTPEGGELVPLPQAPVESSGVNRTAQLTLDEEGTLRGDVVELWSGEMGAEQRYLLRSLPLDTDRIKPLEARLAESLANFEVTKAALGDLTNVDRPLQWRYTFEAQRYAKVAGDLLLVRPRVMGILTSGFLENTKRPRQYPIELDVPARHTDTFEIAIPEGFIVEELPQRVEQDLGFVAYRSSAEVVGRTLRFTRTLDIKELSVPVDRAEKLKLFYRAIYNDERNSAVLKRAGSDS